MRSLSYPAGCRWRRVLVLLLLALAGCGDGERSIDDAFTGRAVLSGPLAQAQVALYALSSLDGAPLYATTTTPGPRLDRAGLFSIPRDLPTEHELYLVTVTGGLDLDADGDGRPDPQPTVHRGAIHGLLTADQIRRGKFYVSILTEVLYRRLYYLLAAAYPPQTLTAELNLRAAIALAQDLDGDGDRDADDTAVWHPLEHAGALARGLPAYRALLPRLYRGEPPGDAALALTERILSATALPGGAQTQDVAVADRRAYVITRAPFGRQTADLHLFDVANPAAPKRLGSLALPGLAGKIAVAGRLAGIIGRGPVPGDPDKLWLVAVRDPARPVLLSTVDIPADGVALALVDNRAYVAYETPANAGLQVFRIDNPAAPILLGSVFIPGEIADFTVAGQIAYLAEGNAGLRLVNVADPAAVRELGRITGAGPIRNIAVAGTIAYLTQESAKPAGTAWLRVVDIRHPARPVLLGSAAIAGYARALRVEGSRAYLIDSLTAAAVQVIDIGRPAAPQVLGPLATPGTAEALAVAGAVGYLADGDALRTVYLGTPWVSPILGSWTAPQPPIQALAAARNRVYLAAAGQLYLIDAADPARPKTLGSVRAGGEINALKVLGDHVYLAETALEPDSRPFSGLQVIAAGASAGLLLKGELATPQGVQDVAVAPDRVYLTETNCLRVVAAGDPGRPALVSALRTAGEFGRLEVTGALAYVAEYLDEERSFSRLVSVDIGNPFNPTRLGALPTAGIISALAVAGNRLYLADSAALRLIDIANPAQPVQLSAIATPKPAWDGALNGGLVYLADGEAVRMIDVVDPAAPVYRAAVTVPGAATLVATGGDYLYAATLGSLHILRLPRRPVP